MDERIERFRRLVNQPADSQMVITPNRHLLDEIERLGSDPRRPRTAIARWISKMWLENTHEAIRNDIEDVSLPATHSEKELMERPAHYPSDWGLDLIPFPDDLDNGWELDRLSTACYTSLTTPRPFDPHLHGDLSATTEGFGYHYLSSSGFPDQYDIVSRRGGGPRGGFAFTTGPTEGAYPTSILPQPTFNLGRLGFSDGGWNPEGLQWTNRPKRMSLTGLRNGWAHKVMFARSRRVMNRNLYGPLARDEATPKAPIAVVNGLTPIHGIVSVSVSRSMNSPTLARIEVNNTSGIRSGSVREGDTVQIFASPRFWAHPPLVFTGFVSEITEDGSRIGIECMDALGYLSREILDTEPAYYQEDAASTIKSIIGNSAYAPPIGRIINQSFVILPSNLKFKGKSRLKAVQSILDVINATPNLVSLRCDANGVIMMERLREVDDASIVPFVAGRVPRTSEPQDFYPTNIGKEEGDFSQFNVVKVINENLNIYVSVPTLGSARYPSSPIERVVKEGFITDEAQARMVGETLLASQKASLNRWTIEGIPERFDIQAGDVVEFASRQAGLSGRHRVFNVGWMMTPDGSTMTLTVGRQAPDLIGTLRLSAGLAND